MGPLNLFPTFSNFLRLEKKFDGGSSSFRFLRKVTFAEFGLEAKYFFSPQKTFSARFPDWVKAALYFFWRLVLDHYCSRAWYSSCTTLKAARTLSWDIFVGDRKNFCTNEATASHVTLFWRKITPRASRSHTRAIKTKDSQDSFLL